MLTSTLIHLTETANKLACPLLLDKVSKYVTGISVCDTPGSCLPPGYKVLDKTLSSLQAVNTWQAAFNYITAGRL